MWLYEEENLEVVGVGMREEKVSLFSWLWLELELVVPWQGHANQLEGLEQ